MKKNCFVCRNFYQFSDEIVCMNGCGHVYHLECFDEWKNIANFCFKCGQEVESIINYRIKLLKIRSLKQKMTLQSYEIEKEKKDF